jgi:S-disulfanyl-L-cysteine oxidoreductase SoxD
VTQRANTNRWGGRPLLGIATAALIAILSTAMHAQGGRTVQDGVFTDAQATRGQTLYGQRCAACHGAALNGAQGPPLTGATFVTHWETEPLSTLLTKIEKTMPLDAPGQLTSQQVTDLVAHILKSNGLRAGRSDLVAADAAGINWPARPATATATAPTTGRVFPPVGNVAQLMRGIFFTNSNLIFTVQTHDPAEKVAPPKPDAQGGGFSWVDWGAGIYGGWQLIDNAAVAIADVSPLLLTPGLRCENGREAPVNDPDWIKFTEQMIAVSKQVYRISQTRSQEAVSDATGDLADACAACHGVYRDVRGQGRAPDPIDPANKAFRCMHR